MDEQDLGASFGPGCEASPSAGQEAVFAESHPIAQEEWPAIEYDGCYPVDEDFTFWVDQGTPPLDFAKAARWLLSELPRASEHMLCFCDIESGIDVVGKPCKLIKFSTGGWSGAESIIALIERRFDLSHHMLSWRRGGHYVFEIPRALLRDSGRQPKAEDPKGLSGEAMPERPNEDSASPNPDCGGSEHGR